VVERSRSWFWRRQSPGHSSCPLGLWLQRAWRRRESAGDTSRVERSGRCSCRELQLQKSVRRIFPFGKAGRKVGTPAG
jgi:hypothetical protein